MPDLLYPFLFRFERFLHLFVSAHHRSSYWTWLPFHLRVVILWHVPPAFVLAHCVNRPGYGPVGSTAQIYCQDSTISTRQVCEYPDSTISKEWQIIMTLNRKLLESRGKNRFASYEVHTGHFFYNVNGTVSFGNRSTLPTYIWI